MNLDRRQFSILATALAVGLAVSATVGGEIDPAQMHEIARGERAGTFSARTIVAAVEIDHAESTQPQRSQTNVDETPERKTIRRIFR